MKFYDRKKEMDLLNREFGLVRQKRLGRFVVVSGRRRVGKTSLLFKIAEENKDFVFVYLFALNELLAKNKLFYKTYFCVIILYLIEPMGWLLRNGGDSMTVYESLSLMVAFGTLIAIILSKK